MKGQIERLRESLKKDKQVPDYVKGLIEDMLTEFENAAAIQAAKMALVYFRTKQNEREEKK